VKRRRLRPHNLHSPPRGVSSRAPVTVTPCPLFNERRSPRPIEVRSVGVGFCVRFVICGVWASTEQRRRRDCFPPARCWVLAAHTSGSALEDERQPAPRRPAMSGLRRVGLERRSEGRTPRCPLPAKRHIDTSTGARPRRARKSLIGTRVACHSTPKRQKEAGAAGVPTASNTARVAGLRSRKVRARARRRARSSQPPFWIDFEYRRQPRIKAAEY
jgi:hypothetical protein